MLRAGVVWRNAVWEARPPSSSAAALSGSSTPLPSLPFPALWSGVSGQGAEEKNQSRGGESGPRGREGPGAGRSARCRALPPEPPPPRPGRSHYAGGLPATAMGSRAVVRAGRSPHGLRVRAAAAAPARAALPLSRPLPPRSNSSSSFPMPLFLLLLLILVLLLEDAGAQQGEWSPGCARRAESLGRRGRRGSLGDAGSPGRDLNLQMCGGGAVRPGAWPDLALHSVG